MDVPMAKVLRRFELMARGVQGSSFHETASASEGRPQSSATGIFFFWWGSIFWRFSKGFFFFGGIPLLLPPPSSLLLLPAKAEAGGAPGFPLPPFRSSGTSRKDRYRPCFRDRKTLPEGRSSRIHSVPTSSSCLVAEMVPFAEQLTKNCSSGRYSLRLSGSASFRTNWILSDLRRLSVTLGKAPMDRGTEGGASPVSLSAGASLPDAEAAAAET